MSRRKHSIGKEISATDSLDLIRDKAIFGKLHHMKDVFEAMSKIQASTLPEEEAAEADDIYKCELARFLEKKPKAGAKALEEFKKQYLAEPTQCLTNWMLRAVKNGSPASLREMADVLEALLVKKPCSPIEYILWIVKDTHEELSKRKRSKDLIKAWPFTATVLRRYVQGFTGSEPSLSAIRLAAKKVGIPMKKGKAGRPKSKN